MKILVVHNTGNSLLPSGESVVALQEVNALQKRGHDVYWYPFQTPKSATLLQRLKLGLTLIWSPSSYYLMRSLLHKYSPDIVHFHSVLPALTVSAFQACRVNQVPVVQTLHNYRWFCVEGGMFYNHSYCDDCLMISPLQGIKKRCAQGSFFTSTALTLNNMIHRKSRSLFRLVNKFIAVSEFVRNRYIEAGFPPEKIIVRHNSIDLEAINRLPRNTSRKMGVTFVGRMVQAKGVDILGQVMLQLPTMPFNIIGDGPELTRLKSFIESRHLNNVTLHGNLPPEEVYQKLSQAACVIIPSLAAETFGLVALEALACNTPVVASRVGALPEIVERSRGGILVDPQAPASTYVTAIKEIVDNPVRMQTMGHDGQQYVAEHFDLNTTVNHLLSLYNKEIANQRIR